MCGIYSCSLKNMTKARTSYRLFSGMVKDRYWCGRLSWVLQFQTTCKLPILCFENAPRGRNKSVTCSDLIEVWTRQTAKVHLLNIILEMWGLFGVTLKLSWTLLGSLENPGLHEEGFCLIARPPEPRLQIAFCKAMNVSSQALARPGNTKE